MRKTLSERLNFSTREENEKCVKIRKWHSINFYETLCLYCANNNINTDPISFDEFTGCVDILKSHGQADKSCDHYYFWIEEK